MFIGSSREGKAVAEAVQLNLEGEIDSAVWSQGLFGLSESPLESLDRVSRDFDFAVLIVTPDDIVEARGERQAAPRDNILFEAGFFVGRLGRKRTFLVCPSDVEIRLPSDLAGLTSARYSDSGPQNVQVALGPACTRMKTAILRLMGVGSDARMEKNGAAESSGGLIPRPRRQRSLGIARVQGPLESMRIVNISVTGALLESTGEVPVGTLLELSVQLDNNAVIHATARVVRVQFPGWGRVGAVGVAFTDMAPASRAALEQFVEQ